MTSPVERISGPRRIVVPGKRTNGKTDSLMHQCFGVISSVNPSSGSVLRHGLAASFASGTPMASEKGTVREARGFTSKT